MMDTDSFPKLSSRPYSRHPLSLAPMIDRSNRDWRWVMRRITRKTLFYTEMISAPALLHGNRKQLLDFDPSEKPLVLQLGWDEAKDLAQACQIAEDWGYDEINLNCGCPSDKVQRHSFGACLMARPSHVAHLVEAMASATSLPVTVKHRIGIRSLKNNLVLESYDDLIHFVKTVASAGCQKFIAHARIAILEGLSPRENRSVPPLRLDDVYRLKEEIPNLFVEINGGYKSFQAIDTALNRVDGVMLGRLALDNPWLLADADRHCFGVQNIRPPNRAEFFDAVLPYLARRAGEGVSLGRLVQPLLNVMAGYPGAKKWKRLLSSFPAGAPKDFFKGLQKAVGLLDKGLLQSRSAFFLGEV